MKIIVKIILSIIFIIFIFNICVYPVNNISDCSKMSQIMSTANFLHDDSNYKEQWALNNINKDEISFGINMPKKEEIDITKKEEVIVGIIDSGIDINHINLREHIYVNSNEIPDNGIDDDKNGYIDDINGWDFVNNDNTVFDYFNIDKHGTQCAGIIKLVSEEFNVKIMPLKVMEGNENATVDVIIKAIEYSKKMNIKIINCSWEGTEYDQLLENEMKLSNIIYICAAGNNSCDIEKIFSYPVCYNIPNLLTVGSINGAGNISDFSNYGKFVHLLAPGEQIITTVPNNKYENVSGTSFAAPFVTGIVCNLRNICSDITNEEIIDIIIDSVYKIENLEGKVLSGGVIDGRKALCNDFVLQKHEKHDKLYEEKTYSNQLIE